MSRLPTPASRAASSPPQTAVYQAFELVSPDTSLAAPTVEQLAGLMALPIGMIRPEKKAGKPKKLHIVAPNRSVAKTYDFLSARPNPDLGIPDQQQVILALNVTPVTFFTTSTSISVGASAMFQLADCDGYVDPIYTFDQYKILQVECWIEPKAPEGTSIFPLLTTGIDYDDNTVPTSVNLVEGKPSTLSGMGQSRYYRFVPQMAVAAYSGAFTSYSATEPQWIDCASASVQHYGVKAWAQSTPSGTVVYSITRRITVAFRQVSLS